MASALAPTGTRTAALSSQIGAWRNALTEGRKALKAAFLEKPDPAKALDRQRVLVDEVLKTIWSETGQSDELALIAVGGYGRGTLYPYSDVDVLVLLPDQASDAARARVEELVGVLWDIGLEIGHSVRTIAGCSEEAGRDITVQTTLLESRLVAGNRKLYSRFDKTIEEGLDIPYFVEAKLLEQQQRHTRFNDTAYNLEPNLKESPGGLRDLQNILWIAHAAKLGHSWAISPDSAFSPARKRGNCSATDPRSPNCGCGCTIWPRGARTACCSTISPHWRRSTGFPIRRPGAPANS